MGKAKTAGVVLLLAAAVGAAGYSFYNTFLVKPPNTGTPEERAASFKKMEAFAAGRPAAKPAEKR